MKKIIYLFTIIILFNFIPKFSLASSLDGIMDTLDVEVATKGKKLKQYFENSSLNLSFDGIIKTYKFTDKKYEIYINNQIKETGKWKVHGLLKNQIKLEPEDGSKKYYLKKISKKDKIYHFNKIPGSEGAKKTSVTILSSDTKMASNKIISNEQTEKPKKKKENKKIIKKKKDKEEKKPKKSTEYKELSSNELKKLEAHAKNSEKIQIIKSDDNFIEVTKENMQAGQYIAANHCAKRKLFAYSFKDSGFGEWYEPPTKRAKFFYCTDQLIFVNPFTSKEVTWTNYVFDEYFKYSPEYKYMYRKITSRYKRHLEKDKKQNPKKYKFQPFKIIHKDENSIHIVGEFAGDQNRERHLANEHCSQMNKKYYYFEDSFQHGRFGSMLFLCSDKHLSSNPLSGLPLMYASGSENYIVNTNDQNYISASEMLKYNSTNKTTFYFFEASDNLMKSLELLYRAYDQNVEADKLMAQISYNRESKYSEQDKLASTRVIIDTSSKEINAKISDASLVLSDIGRGYYEQSLPYALEAAMNSYTLIMTIRETFQQGTQSGDSFLTYANEFIGFFTVAKDLPNLASDIYKTSQLVFSGAKSKNIRDKGNYGKALDELNLDI